jgi:hypothetical protein
VQVPLVQLPSTTGTTMVLTLLLWLEDGEERRRAVEER